MFGSITRNIEQERLDSVDALTAYDLELGHYLETAHVLSARITLFERMKDTAAFRDLCNLCADEFMREYFAVTSEDNSEEAKTKRIEMRAKAEAVKSLANMYEDLQAQRSFNNSKILQVKQAIKEVQSQLEEMTNAE